MSDRRLVVAEVDPHDPHNGELFAISPNTATGISLPTFRIGNTLPTVGNTVGESFYEQSTKKAFVWNGSAWREVAASPVKRFVDRTALLADTVEPVGTFAVTADTGEVYIKQVTGWAFIGIKEYGTAALLLADAVQTGAIATALDEGSLWQKQTSGWRCISIRELADLAAVQAWAGTPSQGVHVGDTALALDNELTYVRTSAGWRPESLWEDTEANIRAATWPLNGQEAIATDTGRTFARIGGAWIEEPIQHYADETTLLAATVPNGTLAWADDTNVVFTRAAGTWHRISGPQVSVGTTVPTTPGAGDMFYDTAPTGTGLQMYDGTQWQVAGAPNGVLWMVGSIQQSVLTEAQFSTQLGAAEAGKWVLADGRSATGTAYATVTGNATVPDLRGAYLRMAGVNATNTAWNGGTLNSRQEDTTRRPRNTAFTTSHIGNHTHVYQRAVTGYDQGVNAYSANNNDGGQVRTQSEGAGAHSHTITGGGDTETRPKTYSVNYFIKVN
jgi:hypothetical protein